MAKIDYKHRIKNHQSEYDPEAWAKMSQLLEEVPERKIRPFWKRFGWLFLLLFSLSLSGYWSFQQWSASQQTVLKELIPHLETKPKETLVQNPSEELDSKNSLSNSMAKTDVEQAPQNLASNSKTSLSKSTDLKTISSDHAMSNRKEKTSKERFTIPPSENRSTDGSSNAQTPTKGWATLSTEELQSLKTEITEGKLSVNTSSTSPPTQASQQSLEVQTIDLPVLPWESSALDPAEKLDQKIQPLKFKRNQFFATAGAGWASFNGNPGLHFELGTYFKANKIVGLELQTAYHFGKDRQTYMVEPTIVDNERQFDFNFLLHLNLFKNYRHRFALIPGIGYTFYKGNRRVDGADGMIQLDERSSKGINYNASLEYNYQLNPSIILGIRYGLTSYDDSVNYVHFKIYKSL